MNLESGENHSGSCCAGIRTLIRGVLPALAALMLLTLVLSVTRAVGGSEAASAQKGDDQIVARPDPQDVEEFMARKLKAAQLTLEGVMTNRFQQIQDNALQMVELSREAAWKQLASPTYIQDTADFVAAAEYLHRVAVAEDAEGVIMAFNRVSASCAHCHQHVRTPRIADIRPATTTVASADVRAGQM